MMCGDQDNSMVSRDHVPSNSEPAKHPTQQQETCCPYASKSTEKHFVFSSKSGQKQLDCVSEQLKKLSSDNSSELVEEKESELSAQSSVKSLISELVDCVTQQSKQDMSDIPKTTNMCVNLSLSNEPKAEDTQSPTSSNTRIKKPDQRRDDVAPSLVSVLLDAYSYGKRNGLKRPDPPRHNEASKKPEEYLSEKMTKDEFASLLVDKKIGTKIVIQYLLGNITLPPCAFDKFNESKAEDTQSSSSSENNNDNPDQRRDDVAPSVFDVLMDVISYGFRNGLKRIDPPLHKEASKKPEEYLSEKMTKDEFASLLLDEEIGTEITLQCLLENLTLPPCAYDIFFEPKAKDTQSPSSSKANIENPNQWSDDFASSVLDVLVDDQTLDILSICRLEMESAISSLCNEPKAEDTQSPSSSKANIENPDQRRDGDTTSMFDVLMDVVSYGFRNGLKRTDPPLHKEASKKPEEYLSEKMTKDEFASLLLDEEIGPEIAVQCLLKNITTPPCAYEIFYEPKARKDDLDQWRDDFASSVFNVLIQVEVMDILSNCRFDAKMSANSIQTDGKSSSISVNDKSVVDKTCDIVSVEEKLLCAAAIQDKSLLDSNEIVVDLVTDRPCDIFVSKNGEDLAATNVIEVEDTYSSSNNGLLTTPLESTHKTDECTHTDLMLPIVESMVDNAQGKKEATDTAINSSPCDYTASVSVAMNKTESVNAESTTLEHSSNTNIGNNELHHKSTPKNVNTSLDNKNKSNMCVIVFDTLSLGELESAVLQCVSNICDVIECVSSVVDVTTPSADPQVLPELSLPIQPVPKAKPVTTKLVSVPPKQAVGRRNKRQQHSKNEVSAVTTTLSAHLSHLLPSKSVRSKVATTKSQNHSNSYNKSVPSCIGILEQGVLDLTTKPKKAEVERVKPITRLSNRGLIRVFGKAFPEDRSESNRGLIRVFGKAFPEDRSDFVLKVPSVRKLCQSSTLQPDFTAPTLEPPLSVPKKKNCVRVQSPIETDKYIFQIEDYHHTLTPNGQKIYTCEICLGVYQRSFSLKRHYLRSHINYKHLTARDISNCGIVVGDKMSIQSSSNKTVIKKPEPPNHAHDSIESGDTEPKASLPDLFRCHTCGLCFDYKSQLKKHLENHPLADSSIASKPYSCIHCPAQFTHQHNYKKHQSFHSHLTSNTPFSPSSSAVAYPCSYCYKAFPSQAVRNKHIQQHKEAASHACMFLCGESFLELHLLRQHLLTTHGREYMGCPSCEERFLERTILEEHKLYHDGRQEMEQPSISITVSKEEIPVKAATSVEPVSHSESVEKLDVDIEVKAPIQVESQVQQDPAVSKSDSGEFRYTCAVCNKMFTNYVNMCRHRRLAHGTIGKHTKPQKSCETVTSDECPSPQTSVESCKPQSPPPVLMTAVKQIDVDESNHTKVSCKIPNNLLNYLDGKLQSGSSDVGRTVSLTSELTITALPPEEEQEGMHKGNSIDESSESQDYSSADDIITPTSHSHRLAWEKYSFPKNYCGRSVDVLELEDVSYLDIGTQLAMKNKASDKALRDNREEKELLASTFLWQELALVEAPLKPECAVEETEISEAECEDPEKIKLSGEWIRPRSYICCTCADKFADLWELEDHMYAAHHNVWWTFLELDASTPVPSDLFHRMLNSGGALCSADQVSCNATTDSDCTKCGRTNHNQAELHRHMLECGGDFSWLFSPTRRKSKWRPFGSRRRRQQGRRGMKRNIPSSTVKIHRGRPRGADSANDTIQRMIANLPAKRASRRVIQFTDDEIKTRSQATIHSVAFSTPFPRLPIKSNKMACLNMKHKRRGRPKLDSPQKKGLNSGIPIDAPDISVMQLSPVPKSPPKKTSIDEEVANVKVIKKRKHSIMNEPITGNKKNQTVKEEVVEKDTQRQQLFPTEPPFICNGCGTEFVASSACERHAKKCVYRHLFQLDTDTPKATNCCTQCNKSFVLPGSLEKHMKNCVKLVPVKSENVCPHCSKSFVFPTAFEKHTKNCSKLIDDLDMPTLQKEEPLKVIRTKKTLPNIPVLSPVNQTPKLKVINVKKRTAVKRKCLLPEVNPVEPGSKQDSCKNEKQSPVPDEALPPNLPPVEAKTVPEKKFSQKTKPLIKKLRKKVDKVGISKADKIAKTKKLKSWATDSPNPEVVSITKKIPLPKIGRKAKKILNGRTSTKTKVSNSTKLSASEVADTIIKTEPVNVGTVQSKVKGTAKTKTKRQAAVKETEVIDETESNTANQEIVTLTKSKPKLKEKERSKPGMKVASLPSPEKTAKFQSNGVLQDHDDNKMGKVTKRKYKMKSKATDLNVTVNDTETPAAKVVVSKKQKGVTKLNNNKFAAKSSTLVQLATKNPGKKQMKRKKKVGDDITKKRIKLSNSLTLPPASPDQQPETCPLKATSVEKPTIKEEKVEPDICEEQPETLTQPSLDAGTAVPSVDATLEPAAAVDAATTSTEVEESSLIEMAPLPEDESKPSTSETTSDCLWCEVCNKVYSSAFNLLKHRSSLKHKRNTEAATVQTKDGKGEDDTAQEVLNSTAEQLDLYINCTVHEDVDAKLPEFDSDFVVPPAPPPSPVDFELEEAVMDKLSIDNDNNVSKGTKRGRGKRKFSRKKKNKKNDTGVPEESDTTTIEIKSEINMDPEVPSILFPTNFLEQTSPDYTEMIPLVDEVSNAESVQPEPSVSSTVLTEKETLPVLAAQEAAGVSNVECITLVKTSDLLKQEDEHEIVGHVKKSNSVTNSTLPEDKIVPDVADEESQKDVPLKNSHLTLHVTSADPVSDINAPPGPLEDANTECIESTKKVDTPPSNSFKTEPAVSSESSFTDEEPTNYFTFPPGFSSWTEFGTSYTGEEEAPSRDAPNWNGSAPKAVWPASYYSPSSSGPPPLPPSTDASQPIANPSFGAILGTVHQVLEDGASEYASSEYSVSGQPVQDCPNPYLMDPFDGRQSFEEIQKAMGATDEEMAMLQQFGQGSLGSHEFVYDNNSSQASFPEGEDLQPLENPDLIDLDNQASNLACSEPQDPQLSPSLLLDETNDVGRYISQFEGGDGLPPSIIPTTKLLSVYEKKEMVCPMCNRHFLGLQALETHISWVHKVKDTKSRIFQKKETSSARDGWCATGYSSLLAREPGCLVGSAAGVVLGSAGGIRGGVLRAAAGAAAEAAEGSSAKKRKLACFVCKELYSDVIALNRHIAQLHLKKKGDSDKDGGLKSQMSTALGGLLDRALSNMLGKAGRNSNQNLRALNKLGLFPCVMSGEKAEEEEQHEEPPTVFKQEPVAEEQDQSGMETLEDATLPEQLFACQHCSDRFSTELSRDEHVTQVHEREVASILLPGGFCKVESSEREQTILPDDPPSSSSSSSVASSLNTFTMPTPEQIAFSQTIERTVPEPPSDELQCPVCLAAMKHYHSLCRHLKTQHCEWTIQAFSTDMYNYLIIKRDSPPELIRKKYSITIPAPRGSVSGSTSKSDVDAEAEMADVLRGQRSSKPCSNSSGNNSDSGSFTPRQPLEQEADHDSIRAKAFAALRQLNQRPSRYGRVQSVPIRGSKRRPLDIYEFFEDEEVETPPLRQSSTTKQEKKSSDSNEEDTKESTELPAESELSPGEDGTYECKNCSKSFDSLKSYCKHSQDLCRSVYTYESSSDDDTELSRKQESNTKASIDTPTDLNCEKKNE